MDYDDEEKNSLSYKLALKFDKRSYCEYYISLLKTKHVFIFAFFHSKDYNVRIIKIDLFLLNFSIYFTVNALFLMTIQCIKYMKTKAHLILFIKFLK